MPFSVRASLEQFSLPHPSGEGEFTISVAAPALEHVMAGAPVVYVLDGDLMFGIAAESARALSSIGALPAHYVVGIGYDAAYANLLKLRTADLSPPLTQTTAAETGAIAEMIGADRNGGADAFLEFLIGTLRSEIAERYPQSKGGVEVLFGHSLGGLFAAHVLLTRPDAFDAFVISSPSLWWDNFSILQKLPAFKRRIAAMTLRPRVFVDVGAKEQDVPTRVPEGAGVSLEEAHAQIRHARMVDAAREFAAGLREAGLSESRFISFSEDDHVTAAPAAIVHGVRFALERAH